MYRENFESYTDNQGRLYIETLMPEDYIGRYEVKSNGKPIRLKIYDPNETQKFHIPNGDNKLKLSKDNTGEQGLIAYFDYYIEEDGSITTGYAQVHPFHKNKKILENIGLFFEKVIPETGSLVIHEIASDYVWRVVEKLKLKIVVPKR